MRPWNVCILQTEPWAGPYVTICRDWVGKGYSHGEFETNFGHIWAKPRILMTYIQSLPDLFFEFRVDMFEDEGSDQNSAVSGRLYTMKDFAGRGTKLADAIPFASTLNTEYIGFSVSHIVNPG